MTHLFPKLVALALCVLFATPVLRAQVAGDHFQIKSKRLGMDPATACEGNPIEDHQRLVNEGVAQNLQFPVSSCEVTVDTVAGYSPTEPMRLLFWKGRLIRLILKFELNEVEDVTSIRGAIGKAYGKPKSRNDKTPFFTELWQAGRQRLELEWMFKSSPMRLGLYVTDESAWSEYDRAKKAIEKAVNSQEQRQRLKDLRD
jgi:hypothetical protein